MTTAALPCTDMRVLIEIRDASLYNPVEAAMWDTVATWDNTGADNSTWDDVNAMFEARDYCRGFSLEFGRQSSWDDLLAATLTIELDNTTGMFSIYGAARTPRIRQGFAIQIDAQWDGVWYPQFRGQITELVESGTPSDFSVKMKAVDKFRRLNDPIEGQYHAGTDSQDGVARIQNLLMMAGMQDEPFHYAASTATMTNYATSRSILEEIHITALSDCGVFFVDRDGTFIYLSRDRVYGRNPLGGIPSFGDACDGSELPYAAVDPIVADNEFGNVITVSNVSQGTDSPQAAIAVDENSIHNYVRMPWSPQQLLICNAQYVQGIADFHLTLRSNAYYRIDSFECYPVHDDGLWPVLLGLRLYDIIFVTRRPPGGQSLMGLMCVDGMHIEATPTMWKFTVRCSPASGFAQNAVLWDDGTAVWDGTSRWV
jgi:hypothetical protein